MPRSGPAQIPGADEHGAAVDQQEDDDEEDSEGEGGQVNGAEEEESVDEVAAMNGVGRAHSSDEQTAKEVEDALKATTAEATKTLAAKATVNSLVGRGKRKDGKPDHIAASPAKVAKSAPVS